MRKLITFATACALLAVVAACGGDSVNSDTRSPTPTKSLTPEERLAIMVLPLKEYGDRYAHFAVDDASGYVDSAEQAEDTIALTDTAADVEARGFITSYRLDFWDDSIIALSRTGAFAVTSEVAMFSDAGAARDFVTKEIADTQAALGQDIGDGVVLTEITPFEVTELGDQAFGAHLTFTMPGLIFYGTVVWVRAGDLLTSVDIAATYRTGDTDAASTLEWAEELQERIEDVASGSVRETPVPIPTAAPTDTPAPVETAVPVG
jgi:hypothetical protein